MKIKIKDGKEILPISIKAGVSISACKEKTGFQTLIKVLIHQPGEKDTGFFMLPDWHLLEASKSKWREDSYIRAFKEIVELSEAEEKKAREILKKISQLRA